MLWLLEDQIAYALGAAAVMKQAEGRARMYGIIVIGMSAFGGYFLCMK